MIIFVILGCFVFGFVWSLLLPKHQSNFIEKQSNKMSAIEQKRDLFIKQYKERKQKIRDDKMKEKGLKTTKFEEIFHEDLFKHLNFIKKQMFGDGIPDMTWITYPDTEECEKLVQEAYADYLKSERFIKAKERHFKNCGPY